MCMSFHFSCFVMFPFFAPKIKNGVLPKDRNPITEINKGTHTVLTPLFYFYFTHNPKTLHGHPEPAVSTPSDGFTPEMTRAYLLSGHSSLKGHGGKDLIGSGVPVRKTNCRKIPLGNKGHASRYYPWDTQWSYVTVCILVCTSHAKSVVIDSPRALEYNSTTGLDDFWMADCRAGDNLKQNCIYFFFHN